MKTENPMQAFVQAHPLFVLMLIDLLLERVGGQISFYATDLAKISENYVGSTITQDFENEHLVVKLHTRKGPEYVVPSRV